MLDLEIFSTVSNYTQQTFPSYYADGTVELAGNVVLSILLILTTGAHPWAVLPVLSVSVALHSAAFVQAWSSLVTSMPPGVFSFLFAGLLPCAVYWINGFFLLMLELKWPNSDLRRRIDSFRAQYKVQKGRFLDIVLDGPNHKPGQLRVIHVVKNLLIGQVFVLIPLAYVLGALAGQGIGASDSPVLPSSWEMVVDIFGSIVIDEVLFYYGHRLFHENTWLYINVHKIHHEFQYPCGLVAAYAHPSEMLISNVLPLGLGLIVLHCNFFTVMVWACAAVVGTQTHHSGYRWPYVMPFDNQPDYHDFHHKAFNTNYGLLGWCDALHGTDTKYWEFVRNKKKGAKAQ